MLVRSQAQQTKTSDARCAYQGMMGRNYKLLSISAAAANLRERVTLAGIERGVHERASLGHGPHSFSVIDNDRGVYSSYEAEGCIKYTVHPCHKHASLGHGPHSFPVIGRGAY